MIKVTEPYKPVVFIIAILVMCGMCLIAGWKIGTVQQQAACGQEKQALAQQIIKAGEEKVTLTENNATLKLELDLVSAQVELLQQKTKAAELAQQAAEQAVKDQQKQSEGRIKKLQSAKQSASGCSAVLSNYWGMRN